MSPDLIERCRELLEWHKTGFLKQDGQMMKFARSIREKHGNVFDVSEAMAIAERNTNTKAKQALIAMVEMSAAPTPEGK